MEDEGGAQPAGPGIAASGNTTDTARIVLVEHPHVGPHADVVLDPDVAGARVGVTTVELVVRTLLFDHEHVDPEPENVVKLVGRESAEAAVEDLHCAEPSWVYYAAVDQQDKKLALRAINYGLYILTATDGTDYAAGGTNWLSQASFEPPLVMAGVKADSGAAAVITKTGEFAVNVLAADQLDIGKAFFRSTQVEGSHLNGHEFEPGPETGAPLILATPYWFECRVTDTVERGDHTIFVAEVVNAGVRDPESAPLLLRDTGMNYGG